MGRQPLAALAGGARPLNRPIRPTEEPNDLAMKQERGNPSRRSGARPARDKASLRASRTPSTSTRSSRRRHAEAHLRPEETKRNLGTAVTGRADAFPISFDIAERLLRAQRSAAAGIWDWDMRTGTLEWSSELFRLFGLDPAKAEATFECWTSVLHPDDRQRARELIEASITDHTQLQSEYRIVLPTGEVRWINAIGNTDYDDAGKPLHMSGVCLDITERKRAEEEARKIHRRQELLSETAERLLVSADPQGVVEELCRSVMDFLDCQVFFNFMVDEQRERLRLNSFAGISGEEARRIEWLDFDVAVCGTVAKEGHRIVAENICEVA